MALADQEFAVQEHEPRSHYKITFAVLAVSLSAFALLQSLAVPVLPTLQHDLHTTQNTVTWVLTAYLLSASIFTPILGRLGDLVGKERVFVMVLVGLTAGSVLAAVATNITVMIIARVIQGIGGGAIPLAFGIVRDEFPKAKIPGAVGLISSLVAVGAGLGTVLAGPIVDTLDYHWLFWFPAIATAIAAIAAHFVIPESPVRSRGRISWLPAILLSGWLVALLVPLSEASVWGWLSLRSMGLFAAAVVLALSWVAVEQRAQTPLIDMKMMRKRAVWTNNLVALMLGVGMYSVFAFVPELLQTPKSTGYGFGSSITQSGVALLPATVTMFLVGLYSGRAAARFGGRTIVILGSAICIVSTLILAFAHGHLWEIFVAAGVLGCGFGLAFAAMSNLVVAAVPPEQTGVASGMNANIRTIGGSIGAAVMASIVTSRLAPDGLPKESGYTIGFAAMSVAMLLAAVAALLIPKPAANPVIDYADEPLHPQLAVVAGGTLVGDKPE